MPKKKIAIALSEWLLDELDGESAARDVSRSAMVEEAVAAYLGRRRSRHEERAYRQKAMAAFEDMVAFATEVERDPVAQLEPPTLERLRALRAEGRGIGS